MPHCCCVEYTPKKDVCKNCNKKNLKSIFTKGVATGNLAMNCYSIASTRWLVTVNDTITQGLSSYCGAGNEVNCTVTEGNCTVCLDLGQNNECKKLEQEVDELIVFWFLIGAFILRLIVSVGVGLVMQNREM
ncbi:uncharacterized protein LOC144431908 [Styela clava]